MADTFFVLRTVVLMACGMLVVNHPTEAQEKSVMSKVEVRDAARSEAARIAMFIMQESAVESGHPRPSRIRFLPGEHLHEIHGAITSLSAISAPVQCTGQVVDDVLQVNCNEVSEELSWLHQHHLDNLAAGRSVIGGLARTTHEGDQHNVTLRFLGGMSLLTTVNGLVHWQRTYLHLPLISLGLRDSIPENGELDARYVVTVSLGGTMSPYSTGTSSP